MLESRARPLFLVADDAPLIAQLVVELLRESDVDVLGPATDGIEALQLFRVHRPDGAVLDFDMPGANGLEVLRAIREDPEAPACIVIMLTGHADPSLREACLAAGADHFLDKTEFTRLTPIVAAHRAVWRAPTHQRRHFPDSASDK
jgi:CheY-like chemotaxis protein